jgi:hypothetical protein
MVAMAGHDDDLLTRFVDGDPDAFVAFYRTCRPFWVFSCAGHATRS